MVDLRLLDVYEAAYLAGGPDRAVDTAVVALVETLRVRVQSTGELSVIEDRPRHEMEALVLRAIGPRGGRHVDMVRWHARRDERLAVFADRLRREGLLSGGGLAGRLGRFGQPLSLTVAGRRALRQLRAEPPVRGVSPGTSAPAVALGGPRQMADVKLRKALFEQEQPVRRFRRRGRLAAGSPGGPQGVAACGAGGNSCSGGSCGGGCGGGT
jgi:hypothetical protein